MTWIDQYIADRSQTDPEFATAVKQDSQRLDAAVAVRGLREQLDLSQRQFAELVGKPQSTIARIESGSMNASMKLLQDIALAAHRRLRIEFI